MADAPINIKLRCASWQQLANIYKRDLSRHAIFLKSATPPPLGTPVRIDLTLPTESMIVLTGAVGEHIPAGGLGGRGPGVDIRLNTIPQSALWLIETALASAQKQGGGAAMGSGPMSTVGTGPTAAIGDRGASGASAATAEAAVDDGRDLADAEDELMTALRQELASLRRLNAFQVLGVGYEASDDDVRSGFAELTRRYHPDRFTRYTSTDLRTLAAEIFILIRDAYRKLGDESSRLKVLATIGARPSVRVPTLQPGAAGGASGGAVSSGVPIAPASAGISGNAPTARAPAASIPPLGQPLPQRSVQRAPVPIPERSPPPAPERIPTPVRPPPADTQRRPIQVAPAAGTIGDDARSDYRAAEDLLDAGRYDEALALFKIYNRKNPADRHARAGIELAEGMRALAGRDRLEAAQRFESVLEMDPANERAARELAEMRRLATNERKGLLSRLMGKKE